MGIAILSQRVMRENYFSTFTLFVSWYWILEKASKIILQLSHPQRDLYGSLQGQGDLETIRLKQDQENDRMPAAAF